ncbi:hypothetical protein [Aliiruegeria lutimaris]|uniref:Methyltransferase small domain-containing protein n=1 Tax=Aliiruegeria lutimaris TaxID=571298 RepID=A0A1G8U703_9RHOB|nr:hypothetical protein [Aliiruegeria lutimaris]SDJ49592.1 hypothetical protein SAMN04488026_101872 [Aliiruegeria lutimaris]
MQQQDMIDIRGLRFPEDRRFLTERVRGDMEEAARNEGILRRLQSLAKPTDRALVLGDGFGLLVAALAGHIGLRHVHVVEANTARRNHLRRVCELNGLFRMTFSADLPAPFVPSLLVCDLSGSANETAGLLENALSDGLRGALVRLSDRFDCASTVLPRLLATGLHYYPRQSCADVLCLLRKWN